MMGFIDRSSIVVWTLAGLLVSASSSRAEHGAAFLAPDPLIYLEIAHPESLLDRLESERVRGFLNAIPGYDAALDSPQLQQLRQVAEFVSAQLDTTWNEGLRRLV